MNWSRFHLIILYLTFIISICSLIVNLEKDSNDLNQINLNYPANLNIDSVENKIDSFIKYYNNDHWEEIYQIFSSYAKEQINEQHIKNEYTKIKKITGDIEFVIFERSNYDNEEKTTKLIYNCEFNNGRGKLIISFFIEEDSIQILGINVKMNLLK